MILISLIEIGLHVPSDRRTANHYPDAVIDSAASGQCL